MWLTGFEACALFGAFILGFGLGGLHAARRWRTYLRGCVNLALHRGWTTKEVVEKLSGDLAYNSHVVPDLTYCPTPRCNWLMDRTDVGWKCGLCGAEVPYTVENRGG